MSAETTTVCLDASFVVRLLVSDEPDHPARTRWRNWSEQGVARVAPALLLYEVSNALYQYEKAGELAPDEVDDALAIALALDIGLVEDDTIHRDAVTLARKHGLAAAYDAHYLALARRLGAQIWTFDRKLARAVGDSFPLLRVLPEPSTR